MTNKNTIFTAKSRGKVNLFLNVMNLRNDNYHQLQSLICYLDFADDIILRLNSEKLLNLNFNGDFADYIDKNNNIFDKIFNYFDKKFNLNCGFDITVTKNIPVGAGLGGGSSNGAVFIKKINEICKLNLDLQELSNIAINFGCDLPLFFYKRATIIEGRGDIIKEFINHNNLDDDLPLIKIPILLINPRIELSTAKVFNYFDRHFLKSNKDDNYNQLLSIDDIIDISKQIKSNLVIINNLSNIIKNRVANQQESNKIGVLMQENINLIYKIIKNTHNNLTNSAMAICPQINNILQSLQNNNAVIARMSGSGASCFGIFNNMLEIENSYHIIKKLYPDFFIIKTNLII
jgi:4-diphosphocytidyl-2-C-methyl-D-erythritol kinase